MCNNVIVRNIYWCYFDTISQLIWFKVHVICSTNINKLLEYKFMSKFWNLKCEPQIAFWFAFIPRNEESFNLILCNLFRTYKNECTFCYFVKYTNNTLMIIIALYINTLWKWNMSDFLLHSKYFMAHFFFWHVFVVIFGKSKKVFFIGFSKEIKLRVDFLTQTDKINTHKKYWCSKRNSFLSASITQKWSASLLHDFQGSLTTLI